MPTTIESEEFRKRTFRLLEAFVYDYLKKSGCTETAQTYYNEANLSNWPPRWLSNPSESSSFSSADNIVQAKFPSVPSKTFNLGEGNHSRVHNIHRQMDDNKIKYEENSKANISAELPDIPLPLKDGFLKEFWDILWDKYKDLFENINNVNLSD